MYLLTSTTPRITWTKTVSSAAPVNHQRARVRSAVSQCAASAHEPASPLEMMTTHAQLLCRLRKDDAFRVDLGAWAARRDDRVGDRQDVGATLPKHRLTRRT